MKNRSNPRHQGIINAWKDELGFGFITPNDGGSALFVHISAFANRGRRPAKGDIVTYHLGANEKGPRAEQVAFVRSQTLRRGTVSNQRTTSLILALAFLGFVAACVASGKLPLLFFGFYIGASVVTYLAYAADKSAARKNTWRISEQTLHLLGLFGGWPGALVAQQRLRHKSTKASFRATFWTTVVIHCLAFGWLLTAAGTAVLQSVFQSS